ncbi:hypothetical protein [Segnochrobactrum spirostomi]|uniref:DUF5666 domain-containing protein n=1 Tax=Segnochrobactrum spirostomi TaxID=2608987 RepID=A0A6A7Y1F3_9HYPH|nr:hypothetical protein [Segnochrobactrum spirostomi]MQT12814.1 hypothetical protein [Segnochrobactrum spirostomi]
MTTLSTSLRAGLLALALGAAAVAPAVAQPAPGPATVTIQGLGTIPVTYRQLTVVSFDKAAREVTVKKPNGDQYAYVISPTVTGTFSQLQPNERILVGTAPGAVTALKKADSGKKGLLSQGIMDISETGPLPENFWGSKITIDAVLVDVDKTKGTVTFEGHDKELRTMPATNAQVSGDLAQIQPGDLCQITYVDAMTVFFNK